MTTNNPSAEREEYVNYMKFVEEVGSDLYTGKEFLFFQHLSGNIEFDFPLETEYLSNVMHKMGAIKHHITNYIEIERRHLKRCKEYIESCKKVKIGFIYDKRILIYEFESFLFQTKACLDFFSEHIGHCYKNNPNDISALVKVLDENIRNKKARQIKKIISKNKYWLDDFNSKNFNRSMRDVITHYKRLYISPMFVDPRKKKKIQRLTYKRRLLSNLMIFYYSRILRMFKEIYYIQYEENLKHLDMRKY